MTNRLPIWDNLVKQPLSLDVNVTPLVKVWVASKMRLLQLIIIAIDAALLGNLSENTLEILCLIFSATHR